MKNSINMVRITALYCEYLSIFWSNRASLSNLVNFTKWMLPCPDSWREERERGGKKRKEYTLISRTNALKRDRDCSWNKAMIRVVNRKSKEDIDIEGWIDNNYVLLRIINLLLSRLYHSSRRYVARSVAETYPTAFPRTRRNLYTVQFNNTSTFAKRTSFTSSLSDIAQLGISFSLHFSLEHRRFIGFESWIGVTVSSEHKTPRAYRATMVGKNM